MKRLSLGIAAALLITSLGVTPVYATEQEQLVLTNEDSETANEGLFSFDGSEDLVTLRQMLTDMIEKINQLEEDLINKGDEIDLAEMDLKEAEELEARQYEAMKLRIRYMYENGGGQVMLAILNAENVADALNKAEYASEISAYDREMILAYVDTQNEIKALKEQLEIEKTQMLELKAAFEDQQEELNRLIEEKEAEEGFQQALAMAVQVALSSDAGLAAAVDQSLATGDMSYLENYAASSGSNIASALASSGYTNSSAVVNAIIDAAYSQIGTWYSWGGSTPNVALDCSGLVQYCYGQAGIYVPHYSGDIAAMGTETNEPKPGDVCWWPGHVGIYIGDGQYIDAQQEGTQVAVRNLSRRSQPVFYQIGSYTEDSYAAAQEAANAAAEAENQEQEQIEEDEEMTDQNSSGDHFFADEDGAW